VIIYHVLADCYNDHSNGGLDRTPDQLVGIFPKHEKYPRNVSPWQGWTFDVLITPWENVAFMYLAPAVYHSDNTPNHHRMIPASFPH
jgi:hypothetical protein